MWLNRPTSRTMLAFALAILAELLISFTLRLPFKSSVFVALTAFYLPFYLDPAHLAIRRHKPHLSYTRGVAHWSGWRFIWTTVLGLPPAEVRLHDPSSFGDPRAQRIYGSHPHGVMSFHHICTMMLPSTCAVGRSFEAVSPGAHRRELGASILFRLPLIRELALALGCCDAGRVVADRVLDEGKSIGLMVGGEQEQLLSAHAEHTVYVNKRKGIIKLALRHGVPLVPCYCFGETSLYRQSRLALRFRQLVASKLGVALTLPLGRSWLLPLLPIPGVRLMHVVGKPIPVARKAEPSDADISALHAQYIRGLREVFDAHKAECGCPDATLVVM